MGRSGTISSPPDCLVAPLPQIPTYAILIFKISTNMSATGSNCFSIQTLTMSHVSQTIVRSRKGKIQAKSKQKILKIFIYLIFIDLFFGNSF